MCGFAVLFAAGGGPPDSAVADRMAELIAHRGPDDAGTFCEGSIALAFRRLAIFDLAESSHQPMPSADGRYVIVFNGAIYNFVELRTELAALGHAFRSSGDTEVLLAAYSEWGVDCLRRLNGMWAFVVYDRRERRIFAARDRFGVKPLFWHHDGRGLALASEIKALRDSGYVRSAPNWRTVARFLLDGDLDANDATFYAGIERVPAGTYFEGDAGTRPDFRRYWHLEDALALPEPQDPVAEFKHLFDDAVRLRMRSDVPLGVFLSGGLDSTSVIASMAEQRRLGDTREIAALCYFDPLFDETRYIDATLEQTGASLCKLIPNYERLWASFDRHLWYQDEPVHSFTSVVLYELLQLVRERGLKVMLSGQGADEVLAGYPTYFVQYWVDLVRGGHMRRAHREIASFARAHGQRPTALYAAVMRRCSNHLKRLVPGHSRLAVMRARAHAAKDRLVSEDVKSYWEPSRRPHPRTLAESLEASIERDGLPVYLRVEDRNSMAHAVEVRMPFLDHRLVSLAFRLGPQWKLRGGYTKAVLRDAMASRIPEIVRKRVQKFGFPTSLSDWFRGKLAQNCRELLATREFRESGIWNVPELERVLDRHESGAELASDRLFQVSQLAKWSALSRFNLLLAFLPPLFEQIASLS